MPKPPVKFPLNVNLESVDGTIERGKIVNGFAELSSAQEVRVHKRPALTLAQGSFAAFGQGMAYTPNGQLFVISGGEIYNPVPSQSYSALSTFNSPAISHIVAYNGAMYGIAADAVIYRALPPFTSWSTLGTGPFSGSGASAIAHAGYLHVWSGSNVYYSTSGTAWSTYTNGPFAGIPGSDAHLYSLNGTLHGILTVGTGEFSYRSANLGATAWSVGTMTTTATGTMVSFYAGTHNGRLYALGTGTGFGVQYSTDGVTWTPAASSNPWASVSSAGRGDSRFASYNNQMVSVFVRGTSTYEAWTSINNGANWTKAATGTSPTLSGAVASTVLLNGKLYLGAQDTSNARMVFFLLGSDGGLTGITSIASLSVPDGELVSLVGLQSGTTFIKTTLAAYTISSGVATQVSDAQYPAETVRGAVYLNGHLYVMEPDGTIWNSAEDDFTSWAGTDFITAEFEADEGVCLAKQGEYVIALGVFTTEAFYDAGNATGSPLAPVSSAVMLIGCAHANSVAQVESALVWVAQQKAQGSTFHKGRFVVVMKGYGAYDRISTPDVERVLDADDFSGVYADILTIAGHVFYVLSLLDSDITLVYDFKAKLWYEWTLATAEAATTITGLTQTDGLATAVSVHGRSDGDQVVVSGVTPSGYNGTLNATVVNSGTFTYPVSSALTGTGTGASMQAQGWSSGALDISASCYFDNSQLVQLRTTGDVYVLDVTGTSDNSAPIDFRIRLRQWDGDSNSEKFMGACEVVGNKVSTTALIRYSDDDYGTWTKFRRLDLSLRRPRARRGGTFSRRAVEFRQTLSARVSVTSIEAEIEQGTG